MLQIKTTRLPTRNELLSLGQRYIFVGFRPVFEIASPNEIPDGTIAPIATLYMGNRPIKVPNNPICVGDIPEYVPGSGLEFLPTVENPDYQIQAIKGSQELFFEVPHTISATNQKGE